MSAALNEDWTADVIGRMHRLKIKNEQLAREVPCSAPYLSTVLNGGKDLSEKGKNKIKHKVFRALERIEARILIMGEAVDNSAGAVSGGKDSDK